MPTPVMHLSLAEEILRRDALSPPVHRLLIQQRGPFLLGHTAPDVQTISGQRRDETHFYSIPRTADHPAHETLFAAHPSLARTELLPPAQAAFVAGYIAHLVLDELWLDDVFLHYFWQDWGTRHERLFLHNVLRTWMDRQDLRRLDDSVATALREAEPWGWLPFVSDEHLRAWRDWLVEQFNPGNSVQTAEVFAQRMGIPVAEVEAVLSSPQQMEERVFRHIPRAALQSFHDTGYERSVALVNWYIGKLGFTTGHFLPNAQIPDAATRCGGLAAKTDSADHVFASPARQRVGASIKLSGSEDQCTNFPIYQSTNLPTIGGTRMNILVTGGAGYIGSVVADELLRAGHTVTVYDSLVHGHRAAVPEGARFVQGDILDHVALGQVMAEGHFDAVMHFAAFIEAGESMREPGRFFRNNVAGSLNLIEAAVTHAIPRFVFSSSAGVYASKDTPLMEDDPLGPASVYGQTKLMIEQMLGWYQRIHGLRYAALRYFNAAGATPERGEAHRPETHLIPNILQVALGQRERFTLFGDDYPTRDGTCVRDYIHVLDLASAHLLALEALDEQEEMIYNLGNGAGYSNLQVLETARQVTGHPIPAEITPRRPGDAPALVADASRVSRELGWEPKHPDLRTIVEHAWGWHRAHPHGYGD